MFCFFSKLLDTSAFYQTPSYHDVPLKHYLTILVNNKESHFEFHFLQRRSEHLMEMHHRNVKLFQWEQIIVRFVQFSLSIIIKLKNSIQAYTICQ